MNILLLLCLPRLATIASLASAAVAGFIPASRRH